MRSIEASKNMETEESDDSIEEDNNESFYKLDVILGQFTKK